MEKHKLIALQKHGKDMARTWQKHCKHMARAWQNHEHCGQVLGWEGLGLAGAALSES
jgi:hypothetical protein